MQVVQSSVFLKYRPLYAFLQRQAPNVALEVQKAYISAARTYYETGFRRYMRTLGWIKVSAPTLFLKGPVRTLSQARTIEKADTLVSEATEKKINVDIERLEHARIEGPGVTLAYMADDKTYVSAIRRRKLENAGSTNVPERSHRELISLVYASLDGQWNCRILVCHDVLRTRAQPSRIVFEGLRCEYVFSEIIPCGRFAVGAGHGLWRHDT